MLQVLLTSMAYGPEAVGRLDDGMVVLVAGGCPGDVVRARLTEEHARFARAEIVDVLGPSPDRRAPPCPHAARGECGGCPWQHIETQAQRREKQALVARELARVDPSAEVLPLRCDVPPFGYRRRVRLGHKHGVLGFRRPGQQRLFQLDTCPVMEPRILAALPEIRRAVAGRAPGSVDVLLDDGGEIHVDGPASCFAQPAAAAEAALIELALRAIPAEARSIVELFAGTGTFTVPLLLRGHEVVAYEVDRPSLARLRERAPGVAAHRADLLRPGACEIGSPDAVLLDPPRAGALECMEAIARSAADTVCYVSCDPMTLCRDLRILIDRGYRIEWAQAVDAFPQTFHVETVCCLRRRGYGWNAGQVGSSVLGMKAQL